MDINLIIYQPGYAGNFLQNLFSIDPSTVPHTEQDTTDRLSVYSFDNAKLFASLSEFHSEHINKHNIKFCTADFEQLSTKYQTLTYSVHPVEYFKSHNLRSNAVTFYLSELSYSDFANFWLIKTKQNNFPVLRPQEIVKEEYIRKNYNPISISIDAFLDSTKWQEEYLKINESMGLLPQLTIATELYQSWYNYRVATIKKEFNELTQQQIESYNQQRFAEELTSRTVCDTTWAEFYNSIRGNTWPDCGNEQDYYQLPQCIQEEIKEQFDYLPFPRIEIT